ncbi:uncharacterized protein TNCV_4631441 [Trichonephila clavipes]|nr:uncharacterized protein TNCV_4631441 [Trichonephila clavipes]
MEIFLQWLISIDVLNIIKLEQIGSMKLKGEYSPSSSSNADASSEQQFHCHKRASGYYADPRFNCEVFHYCHTDGTRVTIPCGKDNQKHRICFLKDIAARACDGSELFLPLPEDLFFKPSKDTTASAFNGATEFKLPEVLPEPAFSSEISPSTTPLSSEDEKKDRSRSLLSPNEVSSIYEVFNSFLKEIETRQDIDAGSNSSPRLRPSTFSRRSKLPSSLEQKDALVDVSPSIERRIDEDSPFLVEVYNDDKQSDDNDYSSYRRKSKKLFFTSDKKTPAKHPRRKRTVPEQQSIHRPYAIVYAKVPDTTMADSLSGLGNSQSSRHESISLPFAPAMVPADVPVVPITIETRRKKKSKKKTPTPVAENSQQGQQVSEQQNVYYYAPDQINNPQQLRPGGRGVMNPQQQVRGNTEARQAQSSPQNGRPQPVQAQNSRPAPYSPQNSSPLQLPNFPFQTRPLVNNEPQPPPYFFGPQQPFGSPFAPLDQFQSSPFIGSQRPDSQQGFRPSNQAQPPRNRQPSEHPSGSQISSDPNNERGRDERPNAPSQQGFPGFQNSFFDGFPGFGSAPFNGPYTPQDPPSFSLLPPQPFSPQLSGLRSPQQPPPERYNEQTRPQRPQYNVQEIPQPPQGQARPESVRQGISVQIQPGLQELPQYGQDRTRQPNRNVQSLSVPPPERPPRMNIRPTSPQNSPPHMSGNLESAQLQPQRRPPSNAVPGERGHPEQFSPYDPRLYQPEYSPEDVRVRPERPPTAPIRNGVPNEQAQGLSRPTTVLVEDYRQRSRPRPQIVQEDPRDTIYIQRQPTPERQPERDRGSPRQPAHSSFYYSPTTPPPSSRTRQPTRTREETRPPTRTREETRPPTRTRDETRPPTRTREETRPPTRTREETRQPIRNERQRQRPRPVDESDIRNVIEERPDFGYRETHPPNERQVSVRTRPTRPESIPGVSNYYQQTSPSRPSNEAHDSRGVQATRPSRHRERPTQPQIEKPPSHTSAYPVVDVHSDPQEYHPYPPQDNSVNVISTIDDSGSRIRTPPTATVRRPSHRGSGPGRDSNNHKNTDSDDIFRPVTQKPYMESYYHTRPVVRENIEIIDEYRAPEKVQENRYQDLNDNLPTTRQLSTTQRPTTKRRPPPPRPTFPTFPTFPPPPRRPITTPRPRTESPDVIKEIPDSYTKESEQPPIPRDVHLDALIDVESFRSKEAVTEDYSQTSTPETTTRRRTRKRKPKSRRPKPTTSYNGEGQTFTDIVTQPTTEKLATSRSTSGRSSSRWRQQTPSQTRRVVTTPVTEVVTTESSSKSEEYGSRINLFGRQRARKPASFQPRISSTTPSAPLLKEESVRVSQVPAVSRGRKPFNNRLRSRTSVTTTASPETEEAVARSDENVEFFNFQSADTTTGETPIPEYVYSTSWPMETTTEGVFTTVSYNQMMETNPEVLTENYDEGTDASQGNNDKADDFESTRSVLKKFQNRPRILKFGKPKLKSTISPIDLNVAESRTV